MPFKHDSMLLDCKDQKLTNQEKMIAEQCFAMDRRGGGRLPDSVLPANRFAPPMVDYSRSDMFNSRHHPDYPIESYGRSLDLRTSSSFHGAHRSFERQFIPSPPVQSSASDDVIFTGTSFCNRDEEYSSHRKPSFGGLDMLELPRQRQDKKSSNILVDLLHSQSPRNLNHHLALGSRSSGNLDILHPQGNSSYHQPMSSFDRSHMDLFDGQPRGSDKLFARHSMSSSSNRYVYLCVVKVGFRCD
jgi:hypothetical protein